MKEKLKKELVNEAYEMGLSNASEYKKEALINWILKFKESQIKFAQAALTGLLSNPIYFNRDTMDELTRSEILYQNAKTIANGMVKELNLYKQ